MLFQAYNLIIKRITRSAIIVEINTKDVKLVKTNISSLRSKRHLQSLCNILLERKDEILVFHQFYIFGINFNNDCASGYSFYKKYYKNEAKFFQEIIYLKK